MDNLKQMHDLARERFKLDPSKCYQRHIRELYADVDNRETIKSLDGATVERITNAEAAGVILKYEWLQRMGSGTKACYGLKLDGKLLGAACFGNGTYSEARMICIPHWKKGLSRAEERSLIATEKQARVYIDKTVSLMRGACVPWAPKNSASFLIRKACKQAYKDFGWQCFFAYSDEAAGEIGTVYQASNWHYLGQNLGRKKPGHSDYRKGHNTINTYALSGKGGDKLLRSLGWTPEQGKKRTWLRNSGYTCVRTNHSDKHKWVWFEGSDRARKRLRAICRYDFKEYPKRPKAYAIE